MGFENLSKTPPVEKAGNSEAKTYTPQEIAEMEEMRARVDKLAETDNNYEDGILELALEESKFREKIAKAGLEKDDVEKLAEKYSDKVLSEIEEERDGSKMPSVEEVARIKKIEERLRTLREKDTRYENSEDVFREALIKFRTNAIRDGVSRADIERLTDEYSEKLLEKLEAEKDRLIDKMTGLRRKDALLEELLGFISLERREKRDCSVLMLDFDHFKKVNDLYGHEGGDEALKQLADIIKSNVRGSDMVYRYGGEEFVVVLPETDLEGATRVAEKIRAAADEGAIIIDDPEKEGEKLKIKTISIGCVSMKVIEKSAPGKSNDEMRQELIERADEALYKAKHTGRNRVIFYQDGQGEASEFREYKLAA